MSVQPQAPVTEHQKLYPRSLQLLQVHVVRLI